MIIKRLINYDDKRKKVLNWELCEKFIYDYNVLINNNNIDTFVIDIRDFEYYDLDALTWLTLFANYWKEKKQKILFIRLPENKNQLKFLYSYGFTNFIEHLNDNNKIPILFDMFITDYESIMLNFYNITQTIKTNNIFKINFLDNKNYNTCKDRYKIKTKEFLTSELFTKYFINVENYIVYLNMLFGKKMEAYNVFLESMDEIWDNVIKHSGNIEDSGSGFISLQITPFNTFRCTVMDSGKGLKERLSEMLNDKKPIDYKDAIKKSLLFHSLADELRGLYKTVKLLAKLEGNYYIRSGNAEAYSKFKNINENNINKPEMLIDDNFTFNEVSFIAGTQIRIEFIAIKEIPNEELIEFYRI